MKTKTFCAVLTVSSAVIAITAFASAVKLDWERQLESSECNGVGNPIVNIVQKVRNDIDSGTAGNYWAYDNFSRKIKIWHTLKINTFCATVEYNGTFQAIAGQISPGGKAVLTGKEKGEFEGGYRATIVGTFSPTWPVKSLVGTVDYGCDQNGSCPGYINWIDKYFTAVESTNLDWWGWIYHGGKYGTWVNAISGNAGDIVPSSKTDTEDNKNTENE